MRIRRIVTLLSLLPGLIVVMHPAPAAAGPQIAWTPCPTNDLPSAQCASLPVPIDWARPRGARIKLGLVRIPAADRRHRIGSLLINPGGPGGSGVQFALFADQYFSPEILRRFDVVGFDPRGIGRSHPVLCPDDPNPPSEFPRTVREYRRMVSYHRDHAAACRRLTGPLFDHADTLSVVRDIDAIRRGLGERKISYYGVSYGTLIGQQYAEEFPSRLRALVLDSNMDHSIASSLRYLLSESIELERSYRQFAAWCPGSTKCALRGQDPIKVLDELMARADKGQLPDPARPGGKLRPEDLAATLFRAMYDPFDWPDLSKYLAQLQTGGPATTAAAAPQVIRDPYYAVLCADFKLPVRDFGDLQRLRAASRLVAPHTRLNSLAWTDVTGCKGYLPRTRNPQHPYRVRGAPPILMTNSRFDVATPYSWAVGAALQIRQAVLLTYDGLGHGDYGRSRCVTNAVDRYLLTLRTPPRGTHCPAEPPPTARQRPFGTQFPAGPR